MQFTAGPHGFHPAVVDEGAGGHVHIGGFQDAFNIIQGDVEMAHSRQIQCDIDLPPAATEYKRIGYAIHLAQVFHQVCGNLA